MQWYPRNWRCTQSWCDAPKTAVRTLKRDLGELTSHHAITSTIYIFIVANQIKKMFLPSTKNIVSNLNPIGAILEGILFGITQGAPTGKSRDSHSPRRVPNAGFRNISGRYSLICTVHQYMIVHDFATFIELHLRLRGSISVSLKNEGVQHLFSNLKFSALCLCSTTSTVGNNIF